MSPFGKFMSPFGSLCPRLWRLELRQDGHLAMEKSAKHSSTIQFSCPAAGRLRFCRDGKEYLRVAKAYLCLKMARKETCLHSENYTTAFIAFVGHMFNMFNNHMINHDLRNSEGSFHHISAFHDLLNSWGSP